MNSQLSAFSSQLSRAQIIHLSRLARAAYDVRPLGDGLGQTCTEWRHDQLDRLLGVRSFAHCTADDYPRLRDHFHRTRLIYLQDSAVHQTQVSLSAIGLATAQGFRSQLSADRSQLSALSSQLSSP